MGPYMCHWEENWIFCGRKFINHIYYPSCCMVALALVGASVSQLGAKNWNKRLLSAPKNFCRRNFLKIKVFLQNCNFSLKTDFFGLSETKTTNYKRIQCIWWHLIMFQIHKGVRRCQTPRFKEKWSQIPRFCAKGIENVDFAGAKPSG